MCSNKIRASAPRLCGTRACATRLRDEARLPSKVAQMLEPVVCAPHLASDQLRRRASDCSAAPRLGSVAAPRGARLGGGVRACCWG